MYYMTRLLTVLALVLVVAAGFSGCSRSDSRVLARIGDENLTVEDFKRYIPASRAIFQSAQDEFDKKRMLLDTIAVTRLLVQAAYEKNIDKLPAIADALQSSRDQFLLEALYQSEITDKISYGDADVRDYYDKLGNIVRASHIVHSDPDTIKSLFNRLKAGEDFGTLAYEYSTDPTAKHNRGDMGYLTYGAADPELEPTAFKLEAGEISPPFKGRFGWHIVKVTDKKPNPKRGEFQNMRVSLEQQVLSRKQYDAVMAYYDTIRSKYPVTVDQTVVDYILHKREQLYPPQLLPNIAMNDFDDSQLDRNEKELVLATWEGGSVTLMQYLSQARTALPPQMRPNFDNTEGLSQAVFQLIMRDMLVFEANREGMDKTDAFRRSMELFKEYSMADIMRNDSIPYPAAPSEEELRKYYDQHRDEFLVPARIHLFEILLNDEMQARKLAREIKSLAEFKRKAGELTERPGLRVKQGDLGIVERTGFADIFDAAWSTRDSAVGGPVPVMGKYSVFMPVERYTEAYGDFLDVKATINDKVIKEGRAQAYQAWLEQRKADVGLEIFEDVLWGTIDKSRYGATETEAADQK
jgi:peptidyl-prolyl cis-trans isomerase C